MPKPAAPRYARIFPVSGAKSFCGSSVVIPALNRVTASGNRGLRGDADLGVAQAIPFGDVYLCLDQIATGDALRHRVFNLNARVDLDEVEPLVID